MRCPQTQPLTYLPESQVTNHLLLFLWKSPRVESEGGGPSSASLGDCFLSWACILQTRFLCPLVHGTQKRFIIFVGSWSTLRINQNQEAFLQKNAHTHTHIFVYIFSRSPNLAMPHNYLGELVRFLCSPFLHSLRQTLQGRCPQDPT